MILLRRLIAARFLLCYANHITEKTYKQRRFLWKIHRQTVCRLNKKGLQNKNIRIEKEQILSIEEREKLKKKSEANRSTGICLADEICRNYRREGRFFDEILEAGE